MPRFQARARTVDMLGRQQIAGIPSAISELFKNAHDAYADRVVVNAIPEQNLFILRDDGIGMSRADFEGRWLTLGTESKTEHGEPPPAPPGKRLRTVLGEKGIGRLAIASIGPQVLVLTRSNSQVLASFINWTLFESPGVNLNDINIPIKVSSTIPGKKAVRALIDEFSENLERLRKLIPGQYLERVEKELKLFTVDPSALRDMLRQPNLDDRPGTQFYINPADENLWADLQEGKNEPSLIVRRLIGFTNTMTPGHRKPPIRTYFYVQQNKYDYSDVLNEANFFTPEEFDAADHRFSGEFDDMGSFHGTIKVFGKAIGGEQTIPSPFNNLSPTRCGPFKINIAVVQGQLSQSRLKPARWSELNEKTSRIGGLYIYRDNIRILPYGGPDYDFLEIEADRSKGAAYYYFSYRRMFGAIEITGERNSGLQEKAGREGFRENAAYRQFKRILKNFLIEVAARYFRETGEYAEYYSSRRSELQRIAKAKAQREQERKAANKALRNQLRELFGRIEREEPQRAVAAILVDLDAALKSARQKGTGDAAINAEARAHDALAAIQTTYRLELPRGVGLDSELRTDADLYQSEYRGLERKVFAPASQEVSKRTQAAMVDMGRRSSAKQRFSRAFAATVERVDALISEDERALKTQLNEVQSALSKAVADYRTRLQTEIEEIKSEAESNASDDALMRVQGRFDRRLMALAYTTHDALSELRTQLAEIRPSGNGSVSSLALREALEDELLALRSRTEQDLELAQIGMAVEVINHEFDATIRSIRSAIRQLRPWASARDELRTIYNKLTTSFEHLDAYLGLFTPLQRRLYRKSTTISGSEIATFVEDLFRQRLKDANVALTVTRKFKDLRFSGIPSTFYPVFVNLIDNAVFWTGRSREAKAIEIDSDGKAMYVSNTGPAIANRDRDRIFEYGFSEKPGGTGLGLYISRQALMRDGYDLRLAPTRGRNSVTFEIRRSE